MNTISSAAPVRADATTASSLAHVPRAYPRNSIATRSLRVTGLFIDQNSIERAYQSVTERGYAPSEIDLLMSEAARRQFFPARCANAKAGDSPDRSRLRVSSNGRARAQAAMAAAFGRSVPLPGLSLVIAGPLAAALAGAGSPIAMSGLSATLSEWNIPEMRVKGYEAALKQGKVLIAVKPRTVADGNHFEQAWKKDDADLWGRRDA
ncbi:MAG: hypothetical protein K0Q76_3725 [Panacagrimonas sp.]|jgi:uncharacterized protein (DUF2062 family)|nr:hypothetical protein [Panacagrimonas sp.]MCC2658617.1 hypothetical protein [Panacagrimonas sp.]